MITFFYHLLRQVESKVMNSNQYKTGQGESIQNSLDLMMLNFPSLKKINHENLFLYKQMSDHSLDLIDNFIYILGAGHIFLSFLWFFIFYR